MVHNYNSEYMYKTKLSDSNMILDRDDTINVVLACDNNYYKYAGFVIASILLNASAEDKLVFYIINNDLKSENKNEILSLKNKKECSINFVDVQDTMFEEYKNIKTFKYITIPTFYRLKVDTLLPPDIHKFIYLDCDVIVNTSLRELYNIDLEGNYIAGISDISATYNGYVNAGILVFDLDIFKNNNLQEKFLQYAIEHKDVIIRGDQEILNEVCKGYIKVVEDKTWNVQSSDFVNRSIFTKNPKIIHYIGKEKPWVKNSICYYKDFYIKTLQQTMWRKSPIELFVYKYFEQPYSMFNYFLHKPTFLLNKNWYKALFKSYVNGDT